MTKIKVTVTLDADLVDMLAATGGKPTKAERAAARELLSGSAS